MRVFAWLVVVLAVVAGCVAIVYGYANRARPVIQPIAFNHTVHLTDADLQCLDCHTDAEHDRFAGLPGKGICLDCHDIDDEEGSHAEKDKLFAFDELDSDIPWHRVAVTNPDVFFSHRRHVKAAGLDCLECHTDQPELAAPPPTARLVMAMNDCIDCHERKSASVDCNSCHR